MSMVDWRDIVAKLQGEPAPLSLSKLKKAFVNKKAGITDAHFKAALDEAVSNGKAFAWTKTSYWHLDPKAKLQNEILRVCSERALKKAEIKIKIKGANAKDLSSIVDDLLAEKKLMQYPALAGTGMLFAASPRGYGVYVEEFVAAKLLKSGLSADGIFSDRVSGEDLESKVWQTLASLEPQINLPVSASRLRSALGGIDKRKVDATILKLRDRRTLYLSQHDHPEGLSQRDRDELVDGNDGRFYVAVTRLED